MMAIHACFFCILPASWLFLLFWMTFMHNFVVSHNTWEVLLCLKEHRQWLRDCKLKCTPVCCICQYSDVIKGAMASQATSLTIVYLNRLFWRRSKKQSKLHVTGLCAWNSPETAEFPVQMASNAENVSIWWRHHVTRSSVSAYKIPSGDSHQPLSNNNTLYLLQWRYSERICHSMLNIH